jgi:hypothetical protein
MSRSAAVLAARVRALRGRLAVRRWEQRQLDHAAGAWHRLARRLALARRAWSISDADAAALLAAGHRLDPVGLAFEPPRQIFVLDADPFAETGPLPDARPLGLESAQEVTLQASAELLACRNLLLLPFTVPLRHAATDLAR